MASSPITSWQKDGEIMETVRDFILGGSKITADGDCSHEMKRHLLLGRKIMTNLDSILKSRDITWPTKARLVKTMVFPVVMYRCESWTIKKAEHQKIDAFELWCYRRLLRVPWIVPWRQRVFTTSSVWSCENLTLSLQGHLVDPHIDPKRLFCFLVVANFTLGTTAPRETEVKGDQTNQS